MQVEVSTRRSPYGDGRAVAARGSSNALAARKPRRARYVRGAGVGPKMHLVGFRRRSQRPPPDVLLALEQEYAEALMLLDRGAVIERMVTSVPHLTGVDVAW